MPKYTDWSPAGVLGPTVANPAVIACPRGLQGESGCHAAVSKTKLSPKKRDSSQLLPSEPRNNNNSEHKEERYVQSNAQAQKHRALAASLLQRQVQVWLFRRQEILRLGEVRRLREELNQAAASLIQTSYRRCVKRRAIIKYIDDAKNYETTLKALLNGCLCRKRQMEEVQRFTTLRKQQKEYEDDQKRRYVCVWLRRYWQARRNLEKLQQTKSNEKMLGWIQRWRLRKRCEARRIVREEEKQKQMKQNASAQAIGSFYQAHKLYRIAKAELQYRRRMRNGLILLVNRYRLCVLRLTQCRWQHQVHDVKLAEEATRKIQRIWRSYAAVAKHAKRITSSVHLQRVFRGHLARVQYARFKREAMILQRNAAATIIQRHTRGRLARLWFNEALCKLRERFRCTNCGVIEPSGTYCKYCGRHRTTSGPLASVLMLHEKWLLEKSFSSSTVKLVPKESPGFISSSSSTLLVASPPKPELRSASLRVTTFSSINSDVEVLRSLPVVVSPRHRRLVVKNGARSYSFCGTNFRRNSTSSIGEQTALRAATIADLQARSTASAQAHALESHLARLEKANSVISKGRVDYRASFM
ncbi:unnamed protein product [Phytophthora lilii]|uniref:Unnamed protein product n=1 Tax=Phytophthora lilii TaxID=2077276 RepID=A0A9W6XDM3_9STRA|nr:unnamed protein product [Phytophthora lilii]